MVAGIYNIYKGRARRLRVTFEEGVSIDFRMYLNHSKTSSNTRVNSCRRRRAISPKSR